MRTWPDVRMSHLDLRACRWAARRAPGRASQGRARALTPGQWRRARRRLGPYTARSFGGLFVPEPSNDADCQR